MNRFLTSVVDGAEWVADTLDDILVEAALGFGAAVPLIVGWAGMRGVVTLAAALALPVDFPGRDAILVAAFAVILFTVLVQGTTLGPLIRRLRLGGGASLPDGHLDASMARVAVNQAALSVLESL